VVDLTGTRWLAEEVAGQRVLVDSVPSLEFDDTGSVGGTTGVNRFHAAYALDGDTLELGPILTTLMAGTSEAMDQEYAWLQVLGGRCAARLDEAGRLVLDSGSTTLVLQRGELPRLL
jgi:heat shock protein HslJ